MSKTLFWYLLKDLLRIFMLASGTLAGIMSFGALMRPLTQHGLDASQVGKILSYFSPAMTTYSFPVAALFATTIVYGRLSADNELTACRACGISHLAMTWPAILLGLLVALISLLFLSFIVPAFTLKVERVIYSNMAQLVANKITRTHEINYGKTSIFAQSAEVKPGEGQTQVVDLIGPMIFTYTEAPSPDGGKSIRVPSKIWMAKRATCYITQKKDTVILEAVLEEGANFARGAGGTQIVIKQAQFGPVELGSPIRENTKFMDIQQLKELLASPEKSRKLQATVQQFIRDEQRAMYFDQVIKELRGPKSFRFASEGEASEALIVSGTDLEVRARLGELIINPKASAEGESGFVRVDRESRNEIVSKDKAKQVRIRLEVLDHAADDPDPRMVVTARGYDVIVEADEDPAAHEQFPRSINISMPPTLQEIEKNDVDYYLNNRQADRQNQERLRTDHRKFTASIRAEMHARASFAVSCFILVMVGCALGMISKSGNFLSAFAVSVVPAMMCVALIITGQHTCENTPKNLGLGLTLIWIGNGIVAVLAVGLLGKLQRE